MSLIWNGDTWSLQSQHGEPSEQEIAQYGGARLREKMPQGELWIEFLVEGLGDADFHAVEQLALELDALH